MLLGKTTLVSGRVQVEADDRMVVMKPTRAVFGRSDIREKGY